MLEVARGCSAGSSAAPEFRVADVGDLPFDDHRFDAAICQQGLQFFPDRPRALGEIRRVLVPGGRIALSVWSEVSPLFVAMADGVRRHVAATLAERVLDPFAFRDAEVIRTLLDEAGFADISCQSLVVQRRIAPAAESVPREFAGSHVAAAIAALPAQVHAAQMEDIGEALGACIAGDGLVVPQQSHLFQARAA